MTRKKMLEKIFISGDEEFDNEHIRPRIDQALIELEKLDLTAEEILKIIDDTLGWNGIGTKFTSQEIDKIIQAIHEAQAKKMEGK